MKVRRNATLPTFGEEAGGTRKPQGHPLSLDPAATTHAAVELQGEILVAVEERRERGRKGGKEGGRKERREEDKRKG